MLIKQGFAPFLPLLTHFQHMVHPEDYETWMKLDFIWVESCDALLRLPGESPGADREVKHAITLGIPVFYSMDELLIYYQNA